jgi:hypothetical protein
MIFDSILLMQFIGSMLLIIGLIPFKSPREGGNLPLVNKIVCLFLASIIFFSLGVASVTPEYVNCYYDETLSVSNCELHSVEDLTLSYFNYGLGLISLLLAFIVILIASVSRNDMHYED